MKFPWKLAVDRRRGGYAQRIHTDERAGIHSEWVVLTDTCGVSPMNNRLYEDDLYLKFLLLG
jgi:hypothetical protein